MIKEQIKQPLSNVGFGLGFKEPHPYKIKGEVFITLDGVEQKFNNVYTLDGRNSAIGFTKNNRWKFFTVKFGV